MTLLQIKLDDMRGVIPPIEPKCGCWILGGAVRAWFTGGEKVSDIDVFGPDQTHLDEFVKQLHHPKLAFEHKNAATYMVDGKLVQIIKMYHPTAAAALERFDFNVCQFAWTEGGIFASQEAIIGVLRGHLAVGKISKEYAVDSLRRAFKYQRKGFEPCWGTLRDIANSLRALSEEEVKNQVEISPNGGGRIVHFD